MILLWIAIGGGLGAVIRAVIANVLQPFHFPYATLIVNLLGSGSIGFLSGLFMIHSSLHNFMIIGFLGGFTTFSTLQLELLQMILNKQWFLFYSYTCLQYVLCFIFCYIGTLF
ncbi:CrcB family protein [Staphylococcus sp. 17KM0847]|uniref:fluoride efflux transporter FluC n=1 Tax=Staphylococcus sp. 17KM0847 TaxID=2583989 RepID=UPI0015DCA307|nr:CrcB family protein [Staphylococcus sp. 17KM0847]QLK86314.1 CrcB family protein [Staphylococcus sp. 17KM0847]